MTLHEAIVEVLSDLPNQSGSFQQVAELINDKKLYQRRDRKPLPANQVKMRAFLARGK